MTPLAMTANCSSPPSSPRATPWRSSETLDLSGRAPVVHEAAEDVDGPALQGGIVEAAAQLDPQPAEAVGPLA